jgi:methenyltetrahydromethanopterin cyclohydrolase
MTISLNEKALAIVEEMLSKSEELEIKVNKASCGTTIIDCGVNVRGSVNAGVYATRITAGDLIQAYVTTMDYGDFSLPVIHISSDYPILATIGGQLGDWEVRYENYFAIGSGPARALALDRNIPMAVGIKRERLRKMGIVTYTPREIYEKIGYKDSYDKAVLMLESSEIPPDGALELISRACNINPENLFVLVAPTSSIVGTVQIAGRVVEVGIHKLGLLGFDFTKILFGSGYAPIAPLHPDPIEMMGRTNDAIRYGGVTYYKVDYSNDEQLKEFIAKVPSQDNKSFVSIFKKAIYGFYDVDLRAFSPAKITITNIKTGNTFTAGHINKKLLRKFLSIY